MKLLYSGIFAPVYQTANQETPDLTSSSDEAVFSDAKASPFRFLGFKAVLCWHYLLLFSPLLMEFQAMSNGNGFMARQLILYLAMGLSFIVCGHVMRRASVSEKLSDVRISVAVFGILGTAAMFACTPLLDLPIAMRYLATAIMGMTEAAVMAAWLHQCIDNNRENMMGSMPADMAIAGIISLLICNLQTPFSYIVYLCLPIIACIGLIAEVETTQRVKANKVADFKALIPKKAVLSIVKIYSPAALFALSFGLLQGSFLSAQIKLLMASDPIILVAIILAAAILYVTVSLNKEGILKISALHRYALVLFVSGAVGLIGVIGANSGIPNSPVALIVCEIAMLAGFNLFDFGLLTLDVAACKNRNVVYQWFSDVSRCVAYTSLAVGLVIGYAITQAFATADSAMVLCFICGLIVVLTVASVLVPSKSFAILEEVGTWESAVEDREETVRESARSKKEALHLNGKKSDLGGELAKIEQGQPRELKAKNEVSAGVVAVESEGLAEKGGNANADGEKETPWKDACKGVAKLFGLTPRETEILIYAAKGRNPEYIQRELYLSIHTVKTHLANIYKKMDVHSSQELISLIEEYRDTYQDGSKKS